MTRQLVRRKRLPLRSVVRWNDTVSLANFYWSIWLGNFFAMFRIMWSFKKFAEFCEFLINGGFLFFVFLSWSGCQLQSSKSFQKQIVSIFTYSCVVNTHLCMAYRRLITIHLVLFNVWQWNTTFLVVISDSIISSNYSTL